jgi:hypothetical protein
MVAAASSGPDRVRARLPAPHEPLPGFARLDGRGRPSLRVHFFVH